MEHMNPALNLLIQFAPLLLILVVIFVVSIIVRSNRRRERVAKVEAALSGNRVAVGGDRTPLPMGAIADSGASVTAAEKRPDEKFCQECGAIIRARAEICPRCGVRQPLLAQARTPVNTRNKLGAGLLAIFLGSFGVHKFYLGRSGMGIFYLLFCWTLIPGIIGFIEGLVYLSMSDQAFEQKYGAS